MEMQQKFAPSMVKLEKKFREFPLKKSEDPVVRYDGMHKHSAPLYSVYIL
jgi:hypothetical protein